MFSLKNKTAIITGAGSGIGKAIAKLFAQQGAHVFIIDLDETCGNNALKEITESGGIADFYYCNITNQKAVQEVIEKIITLVFLVH